VLLVAVREVSADAVGEALGDGRNFVRMSQPGANGVVAFEGKDLGLVLKPAHRRREEDPSVVPLERGPKVSLILLIFPVPAAMRT
jgi:hypothetical protein